MWGREGRFVPLRRGVRGGGEGMVRWWGNGGTRAY